MWSVPGHAEVRWQTALQVSENQDEEDRAANEWLAGNNAAVNQNDLRLHGLDIGVRTPGNQA
ncbi:MAG: hypothetical protein ACI9GK_003314 [Devosia sp.]|jgi:hypothetical protein|tara:strand:- start:2677 stop:2862 length:186 start_codon:yes stop_codon:yes gene_type:complete